jgi:hypothetical protein
MMKHYGAALLAAIMTTPAIALAPVVGTPIKVTSPFISPTNPKNTANGSALWFYRFGQTRITITPQFGGFRDDDGIARSGYNVIEMHRTTKTSHYLAQTAFGARAVVTDTANETTGIALVGKAPRQEDYNPYDSDQQNADNLRNIYVPEHPDAIPERYGYHPMGGYWFGLDMPQAQEMAFVRDLYYEVDGTVAQMSNGETSHCNKRGHEIAPTFDSPTEGSENLCFVGANVTRIAIIQRSTGKVLKEWVTKQPSVEHGG